MTVPGRPRIVLWDVDGTLLDTGGAGGRAWGRAFAELHGVPADIMAFSEVGDTDSHIAVKTFEAVVGRAPTREDIGRLLAVYVLRLQEEVTASDGYRVLPGVEATLQGLIDEGITIGIVSGALEGAARIKLSRGNLNRFFVFGGFGSDSPSRATLTELTIERATTFHTGIVESSEVFIVGDTPNDINAAKAVGAVAVNVATGGFTVQQLRDAGSDHVLTTLEEPFPGV